MGDTYFKYKKLIYRMSYTLLLCAIIFWGVGHFLGLGEMKIGKAMVILGVLALLGTIQVGGARTKGICILTLCVCSVMIGIICGGTTVVDFFSFL